MVYEKCHVSFCCNIGSEDAVELQILGQYILVAEDASIVYAPLEKFDAYKLWLMLWKKHQLEMAFNLLIRHSLHRLEFLLCSRQS